MQRQITNQSLEYSAIMSSYYRLSDRPVRHNVESL